MYTLKAPAFLRPSSRPSSPSPVPPHQDSITPPERVSRASVLSFSSFKRTASPLARPASSTSLAVATPLVQDGSYMELLNLKLSEAVSKALSQPAGPGVPSELLNGRRPIPSGRGRALAELIVSETKAVRENPYLYRAVLRTLHRPLSVLVNNLSNNLMPLLSSNTFLNPPVPSPQFPNPNPTQLHALGLATFAGELLEMYNEVQLCIEGDMRADGLRVVRDSLVSIVKRVVEPLVTGIKNDLVPHIDALENPNTAPLPTSGTNGKPVAAVKVATPHLSILYLQGVMPIYARALSRFITSTTAEATLASLLINLVWRGLVALSNRPAPLVSPAASPVMPSAALKKDGKTPPTTPPASKFALRLPPSRPPSPPAAAVPKSTPAADARALFDLLSSLPRPNGDMVNKRLAQEVVDEAFEALGALPAFLEAVQAHNAYNVKHAMFKSFGGADIMDTNDLEHDLELLTADLPTLVALPVLLRTYFPTPHATGATHPQERSVSSMLGLGETAYRNGCLSGFGRADECTVAVGQHVLSVLRGELRTAAPMEDAAFREATVVLGWLEREVALVAAGDH
ncbi:hypothetical protein EUX98_g4068 [Antrodiella citrinella]|uniref:Uncharacterized protein n=1 Tax=Antrodiella citrinella TaxID=2447956 RepID=A0A4S4MXG0_9APHY|nr:hypothetical protein EUX98_g4068 [Antrodiella citrinella]